MAAGLTARFETEEVGRMDIDLEIGQGTIGLFTVDLMSNPFVKMGYIRCAIGYALGLEQDEFTIKNDQTIVPDSYIAKIYMEEIKDLYNGNLLRLDIDEGKHRDVARRLMSKVKEEKEGAMDVSIVMEELKDHKEITLTIYKPCFHLYVSKFL